MRNDKYKLLISGELEQQTAFSNGGSDDEGLLDMPLARDGQGRFTLRGSSLAGAFIATARTLYPGKDLPAEITEDTPSVQHRKQRGQAVEKLPRMKESVWRFHHAHPIDPPEPEIRDQVAISQNTGAALHTAKFDAEVLPAGTRWRFLMEVDCYRAEDDTAAAIAVAVAEAWQQCCWLGREVARGLGWMKLENLAFRLLTTDQVGQWPDAKKSVWDALDALDVTPARPELHPPKDWATPAPLPSLQCQVTIEPGVAEDGYGVDLLSVGSYQHDPGRDRPQPKALVGKAFLRRHRDKVVKPLGQESATYIEFNDSNSGDTDFSLAVTEIPGEGSQPFIPGAGLRGAMRHALSWLLRRNGAPVWAPGEPLPEHPDLPLRLFGSTAESARLLVSDALLENDWQAVVLEMHAEDEFTQGVYGSGKFDRTALTRGCFKATLHLQAGSQEELEELRQGLAMLQTLAAGRRIPLGGGQWKGLGWVNMNIALPETQPEERHDG